eukprot:s1745_g5.t2
MVETTDAGFKPSRWSRARNSEAAPKTEGYGNPDQRKVYTLGTWRVSREVYLWQLSSLDVKLLVDVRGNPKAGREEQLFKGKDFTKALLTIGVRYEYWGDRLGEDQMCDGPEELQRVLKGLFASAPQGSICILGHMHEPHKCHRLHLCDLLPPGLSVQHLMWEDHRQTKSLSHQEAKTLYNRWVSYFNECLEREKQKRFSNGSTKWRRHGQQKRLGEVEAATLAKSLPVLSWESTSAAEWEEKLRDGKAYRLRLPWDTEILWYPHFLTENEADELEDTVTEKITMYHPTYLFQTPSGVTQETVNRKGQARICDDFNFGIQYDSSRDKSMLYVSQKMEPWTRSLMHRIEHASESVFNAIWFNHYRDGTVTIHWHTDGNEGLGPDPIIGSLSIGATRDFAFKSKREWHGLRQAKDGSMRKSSGIIHLTLPLFHGSLCVMGKNSQRHWLHAVPAMEGIHRERTNLTFRFWALEGFETIDDAEAHSSDAATKRQYRLRVVPSAALLQRMAGGAARCRPVIVDAPREATLSVGEMLKRLQEHVLSPVGEVVLATECESEGGEIDRKVSFEILQNDSVLLEELERVGLWPCQSAGCPVFTLQLLPVASKKTAEKAPLEDVKISDASSRGLGSAGLQLLREVKISCPGPYAPQAEVIDSRNWIQEVIQNLSGIQRKSKGKGRISQMVYHQCSEFCALYLARPKSSVHLVLTPKRPLRFNELSAMEAPLLRRLGLYGDLLREFLGKHHFKVGLQTRKLSRDTQVFAHLISMDLVPPDLSDLTRRHFLEFTAPGSTHFMSLNDLARHLSDGSTLTGRSSNLEQDTLRCHRCGQLFGDSMRQLLLHLRRCEAPEFDASGLNTAAAPSAASSGDRVSAVELLEEMGFRCGREALEDVLLHTKGSVERAVEFLSAQ